MYDYQTSLPAYAAAKTNINEKQEAVFKAIEVLGNCNDSQIADLLGWPINRVTPRRGELLQFGLIQHAFRGKDFDTQRTVNFWKVNFFAQ